VGSEVDGKATIRALEAQIDAWIAAEKDRR